MLINITLPYVFKYYREPFDTSEPPLAPPNRTGITGWLSGWLETKESKRKTDEWRFRLNEWDYKPKESNTGQTTCKDCIGFRPLGSGVRNGVLDVSGDGRCVKDGDSDVWVEVMNGDTCEWAKKC